MACKHTNTRKLDDVKVCLQCGMVLLPDGTVRFDRRMINYKPKKRKKG